MPVLSDIIFFQGYIHGSGVCVYIFLYMDKAGL